MLHTFGILLSALFGSILTQMVSETYRPLQPGQEFYGNSIIVDQSYTNDLRLCYGGWVKVTDSNKMGNIDTVSTNTNIMTLGSSVKLVINTYSNGEYIKFPTLTWHFIVWVRKFSLDGSEQYLDPNGALQTFKKFDPEFILTNTKPLNGSGSVGFSPNTMGYGLNSTRYFRSYPPTVAIYANLFYAVAPNWTILASRIPQYQVGPYNGDIKYHIGNKWNMGIEKYELFYTANGTSAGAHFDIMKTMIDQYGTFIPRNTSLRHSNFVLLNGPNMSPRDDLPNIRSLKFTARLKFDQLTTATSQENATLQCFGITLLPSSGTENYKNISFNLSFSRDPLVLKFNISTRGVSGEVNRSVDLILDPDIDSPIHIFSFTIQITSLDGVYDSSPSAPFVNLLIESAKRDKKYTTDSFKYFSFSVEPFRLPFSLDTECSLDVSFVVLGSTLNSYAYLDSLGLQHGGMNLLQSGIPIPLNIPGCLMQTVVSNRSIGIYCSDCAYGFYSNTSTGACEHPVTGDLGYNSSCEEHSSYSECSTCDSNGYFFSLTQNECIKSTPACPLGFSTEVRMNDRLMKHDRCSDTKYLDRAYSCFQYSNALPFQMNCVCKIPYCSKCMHTPCDQCDFGRYLFVRGKNRACILASEIPMGFGIATNSVPHVRLCKTMGANCTSDYRVDNICRPGLVFDTDKQICLNCSTSLGRTQLGSGECRTCTSPCSTCQTNSTVCLTCRLNLPEKYYLQQDSTCITCDPTVMFPFGSDTHYLYKVEVDPLKPLCMLCSPTCKNCNGNLVTSCTSCRSPNSLYPDNSCGPCTEDNVFVGASNRCLPCHATCRKCSGSGGNECINCTAGLFKYADNSCGLCIEPRVYQNPGICVACHASCLTCSGSSSTSCLTCDRTSSLGFKYSNGACGSCTETNFFISGNDCIQCHATCASCNGPSNSNCLSCISGQFLYPSGQCGSCVEDRYFKGTTLCNPCDISCLKCDGASPIDCILCPSGKFLYDNKTCGDCSDDGVLKIGSTCKKCNPSCLRCQTATDHCTACKGDYMYSNDTCGSCLDQHYYKDEPAKACRQCHGSCKNCNGAGPLSCIECDTSANKFLYFDNSCIDCNGPGQFRDGGNCRKCDTSCKTCNGPSNTNCLTCDTASSLFSNFYPQLNSCGQCAEVKVFIQGNQCLSCHPSCFTCGGSASTNCFTCDKTSRATYFMYPNGSCGSCNENKYFQNGDYCSKCHTNCLKCSGALENQCTMCDLSDPAHAYLNYDNTCGSCTQDRYFHDSTHCLSCNSSCLNCNGPNSNQCTQCDPMTYLYPNSTCGLCVEDRYFKGSSNICLGCHTTCLRCTGVSSNECLTCDVTDLSHNFLYTTSSSCGACTEDRVFQNGILCFNCHTSCLRCIGGSETQCSKCDNSNPLYSNLYLNGTCGSCTEDGWYSSIDSVSGSICKPCHTTCKNCFGSNLDHCTACHTGSNIYLHQNRTCGPCDDTNTYFKDGLKCTPCFPGCKTCSSSAMTDCSSCVEDFLFDPSRVCVNCKRSGYYADNDICYQCNNNCENCTGAATYCTSCRLNNFLNESVHVCTPCNQDGVFKNTTSKTCHNCDWSCRACTGKSNTECTSCHSDVNHYLHENSTCGLCHIIDGYFIAEGRCIACHSSCLSCIGRNSNQCTLCPSFSKLSGGECIWTPLKLVSSTFDKYETTMIWTFETNIQVRDGSLDELAEIKLFDLPQGDLKSSLSAVSFTNDLKSVFGEPIASTTLDKPTISGSSIKVKINPPKPANIENAIGVLRFKNKYALASLLDFSQSFDSPYAYVNNVTIVTTALDAAMDSASGTVSLLVTVIMMPQAFILLRIFNSLDLYVFIDVVYPTLFEKVLEMFSVSIGDYVPNLFASLADDEGSEVHPRLKHFGFEVHFLKNLGPFFTLVIMLFGLWIITWPFRNKIENFWTRQLSKIHELLSAEFWVGLIESTHTEIVLSILVFLASREKVDEWRPLRYLMVCLLSIISLSLLAFYGYLTYTITRIVKSYYTHAIIEIRHMEDEPLRHLLSDKKVSGNWFQRYFTVVLFLREAVMCFVVYFLIKQPKVVTALICLAQLVFTIGVLTSAPYTKKHLNILLQITHVLYLLLNLCLLYLAQTSVAGTVQLLFGFFMIGILAGLVFSNIGFTLYYTAVEWYKGYKFRQMRKKKLEERAKKFSQSNSFGSEVADVGAMDVTMQNDSSIQQLGLGEDSKGMTMTSIIPLSPEKASILEAVPQKKPIINTIKRSQSILSNHNKVRPALKESKRIISIPPISNDSITHQKSVQIQETEKVINEDIETIRDDSVNLD